MPIARRTRKNIGGAVASSLLVLSGAAFADDQAAATLVLASNLDYPSTAPETIGDDSPSDPPEAEQDREARRSKPLLWAPRTDRGAPAMREGGATRGTGRSPILRTLVPEIDEAALTLRASPTLYWYVAAAVDHPVHFTLLDPDAVDPLVETLLEGPFEAGMHAVDLAPLEVSLEPDRVYEWYVAIVPDPDRRSEDTVARGVIRRIAEPDPSDRVEANETDRDIAAARALAAAGIWYDALWRAQQAASGGSASPATRASRDELLRQVGITLEPD